MSSQRTAGLLTTEGAVAAGARELPAPAAVRAERTTQPEPMRDRTRNAPGTPDISVVLLNYNGAAWLDRCLSSLMAQTIAAQIEVIVADNASDDSSDLLAADLMQERPDWRVLRYGENLGYCGGNNEAAGRALGQYLLFLNTDTWLEPECLENLLDEVRATGAVAATPLVLDYRDDTLQSSGEVGFDVFGLPCGPETWSGRQEVLIANGPALFVNTAWFRRLGGFDAEFFMYADEYDLCWRAWISGGKVILAPSARLHHRGSAAVNPGGGPQLVENRTSDTKRYYANRNVLLVLLKNCEHFLLLLVPFQVGLLALEGLCMWVLVRRWTFLRRAYLEPLRDCWRLRGHILAERRRVRKLRRHGDFWMLRFLQPRLNRWREFTRCRRFGLPKVDAK
jgi:GT2 family glycosyltransferase